MSEVAEVTKPPLQSILPHRMKEAEYVRAHYVIDCHEGTAPTDLLDPAYWSHVSKTIKPFDRIEARADNGEWMAELLVIKTGTQEAQVALLNLYDIAKLVGGNPAPKENDYEVEWKGPHKKFCVIRKADQTMVHEGCQTKPEAFQWLANRLKAGS